MAHPEVRTTEFASEGLLETLCLETSEPCAIIDRLGRVLVSSRLFRGVFVREHGMSSLLAELAIRVEGSPVAWADDGWLVGRAASLGEGEPLLVHLFGPAVVRARLFDRVGGVLSSRESECLAIALEGHENSAIATRIGVQPETVKVHLRNAYKKLGSTGRADLLAKMVSWS